MYTLCLKGYGLFVKMYMGKHFCIFFLQNNICLLDIIVTCTLNMLKTEVMLFQTEWIQLSRQVTQWLD